VKESGRSDSIALTPAIAPFHNTLDRGTLRAIIRAVDVTVEEFVALLD